MFITAFHTLVKVVLIPASAVYFLSQTFVGIEVGLLGVNIILTTLLIPVVIWQLIRLFPYLALIRKQKAYRLITEIVIELIALLGFWGIYLFLFG